jgi:hypothetical protein
MSFGYDEFSALREEHRRKKVQEKAGDLRVVAQAVVPMSALTGDPHWDVFLQVLQGAIKQAEKSLAALDAHARGANDFSYKRLVELQVERRLLAERIKTIQEIRDLPKALKEEGEKAAELLGHYEPEERPLP